MKKLMKLAFLMLAFSLAQPLWGRATAKTVTDSRTLSKSFVVNPDAQLNLKAREADIVITTGTSSKLEVKITLTVEAYDQEELDKMLRDFQVDINGSPENVSILPPISIKTQNTIGNRTKIKTENETYRIKSYHFSYQISMPATNHLNLKNSYGKVSLGAHTGRLNLELYECKVEASQIAATEGLINTRYTKAAFGKVKNLDLKAYESKITLAGTEALKLDAKYTKFTTSRARDVVLSAYESDIELGVTQTVKGQHNYGHLKIAEAKKLELKTYELEVETGELSEAIFTDSRYSKISCAATIRLDIQNAYENQMTFAKVGSATANTKYCTLNVGSLSQSIHLKAYETSLRVESIAEDFKSIMLEGKYLKANLHTSDNTGYAIDADLQYGQLSIPETNFEFSTFNKKGDTVKAIGKTRGYRGTSSVEIKGYETDVTLGYK